MKTIKCSQVGGGTCPAEFTAATQEEMRTMLGDHAKEAHADMVASATPESMAEWNAMFDKVWAETPENAETVEGTESTENVENV
jgi:predicted small metal-binding protein